MSGISDTAALLVRSKDKGVFLKAWTAKYVTNLRGRYHEKTDTLLSQLIYWLGPKAGGKDNSGRARIQRGGRYWVAKSYEEWSREIHQSQRTLQRTIKVLEDDGILLKESHIFKGRKVMYLSLIWERVELAMLEHGDEEFLKPTMTHFEDRGFTLESRKELLRRQMEGASFYRKEPRSKWTKCPDPSGQNVQTDLAKMATPVTENITESSKQKGPTHPPIGKIFPEDNTNDPDEDVETLPDEDPINQAEDQLAQVVDRGTWLFGDPGFCTHKGAGLLADLKSLVRAGILTPELIELLLYVDKHVQSSPFESWLSFVISMKRGGSNVAQFILTALDGFKLPTRLMDVICRMGAEDSCWRAFVEAYDDVFDRCRIPEGITKEDQFLLEMGLKHAEAERLLKA